MFPNPLFPPYSLQNVSQSSFSYFFTAKCRRGSLTVTFGRPLNPVLLQWQCQSVCHQMWSLCANITNSWGCSMLNLVNHKRHVWLFLICLIALLQHLQLITLISCYPKILLRLLNLVNLKAGQPGHRGEYFSLSRDSCPCLIFYFSCSYIQTRVFRAEILVRNSYG